MAVYGSDLSIRCVASSLASPPPLWRHPSLRRHPREGGDPVDASLSVWELDRASVEITPHGNASEYWIPAFAGMTIGGCRPRCSLVLRRSVPITASNSARAHRSLAVFGSVSSQGVSGVMERCLAAIQARDFNLSPGIGFRLPALIGSPTAFGLLRPGGIPRWVLPIIPGQQQIQQFRQFLQRELLRLVENMSDAVVYGPMMRAASPGLQAPGVTGPSAS
jgi:hypothetical protein